MSLNMIMTSAGRAAILSAIGTSDTLLVSDVQLSSVDQAVGIGTTSLTNVVVTVPAFGSVRTVEGIHALHIVFVDDSSAAYEVRSLAVRLNDGTLLMVYSQADLIVSKAADSSLHFAIDLAVDADTAAVITFGDTDYMLPMSSEGAPGIIELATSAEIDSGTDALRAVTPAQLARVFRYVGPRIEHMELRADGFVNGGLAVSGDVLACAYSPELNVYVLSTETSSSAQFSPRGRVFVSAVEGDAYKAILWDRHAERFVAIHDGGNTYVSQFGTEWDILGSGVTGNKLRASRDDDPIVGAEHHFVACGIGGALATSQDFVAWTGRTPDGGYTGDFMACAQGAGICLIAGTDAEIQISTDRGNTWESKAASGAFSGTFRGAAVREDVCVVVGDNGEIQYSPDLGETWFVATDHGITQTLNAVVALQHGFAAVGENGTVAWSRDGKKWFQVPGFDSNHDFNVIMRGASGYVIGGDAGILFWSPADLPV